MDTTAGRRTRRAAALAIAMAALAGSPATAHAVTLPLGFADEPVATIASPTALAFTPDGRMLVATQPGRVRVDTPGDGLLPTPALDISARVCANRDRGLVGVAVDPAFVANHFIYVYYTFNKFNNACPTNTTGTPVNRVSRFTLPDANVADPASELVLVDNIPSPNGDHAGGDLQFGKDGDLYISVGDGGCDYAGGGCGGANDASRDQNVLLGKILRITPTGAIPSDNPYAATGLRCNATGVTTAGMRCQETFASGLRNPFRIAFDPNAASTRFRIDDVGQNTWEEIDDGTAGADYGWNVREGHCATGSTTDCGPPPAGMTNPIFDYGHSDGCASITGGAFVPNGLWPASYDNTYLFGDYVCGRIFQLVPNGSGGYTRVTFADGLGASSAVHLAFGPSPTGRALYYTSYAGGGEVRRIFYAAGNRAPTADVTATPTAGPAPLSVAFDGSASSDPDAGDTLTYLWDFGDGSTSTETAAATTSHAYAAAGTYIATLRVRDDHGATSAPDTIRIDVGNAPPVPTISSPAAGQRFAVDETIALRGGATDAEDGTLADSSLSWTVIRHHAAHTHPYLGPVSGNTASVSAPAPEDLEAATNSSLEVQLTATDSKGASATATRIVAPRLVNLTFDTSPSGLMLALDGTAFAAPRTWVSWEGWDLTVEAADQAPYAFASWSDGGGRSHTIHTPATDARLVTTFAGPPQPGDPLGLPAVTSGSGVAVPQRAPTPPASPRPACVRPRSTRSVLVKRPHDETARARVVAIARGRLGARASTRYRVRLTRGCTVIATGVAHGRRLVLMVKPTGTKAIMRHGRPATVKTYPRLIGPYLLRPAASGPRLAVLTVTFES
ncbi:MAG: hypothetical protein QOJ35_3522 [Solirubrobacteraceae bacterium]|nr:hypothetical protein [Solirubrobacteraceae bacterium]